MPKERNATNRTWVRLQNSLLRQIEHLLAAIHAIDSDQRSVLKKCAQKSSIPLTHDEGTARRTDLVETGDPRLLQCVPERDGFERPIPGRHSIEAHNSARMKPATGVSRTRSARAVRSSLPKERRFVNRPSLKLQDAFREPRSSALTLTHPNNAAADR